MGMTAEIEILHGVIGTTAELLSEFIPLLMGTGDEPSRGLASLQEQLDNISMTAGFTGLEGLSRAAELLSEHLATCCGTDQPLSSAELDKLVCWITQAQVYLQSPASADTIAALLEPLPEERRDVLYDVLVQESGRNSSSADPSDAEAEFFEMTDVAPGLILVSGSPVARSAQTLSADDMDDMLAGDGPGSVATSILGMLRQEIEEITPRLSQCAAAIGSAAELADAAGELASYGDLVERLHAASTGAGLDGMVQIADFLTTNLGLLLTATDDQRRAVVPLLAGWPEPIITHLAEPADNSLCLAAVKYLENPHWLQPLIDENVKLLLKGLVKDAETSGECVGEARATHATPEDVELKIADDVTAELVEAFFTESPRYAEQLATHIASIARGEDVQNHLAASQRISHTLKGSANMLGVKGLANLSHHLEDIFEHLAQKDVVPPKPLAATMQEAADTIEVMLEALQGISPAPADALHVLQSVLHWANRIDRGDIRSEDFHEGARAPRVNVVGGPAEAGDEVGEQEGPAQVQVQEALRVPRDIIDNVLNMVGEAAISLSQIQERLQNLRASGVAMRRNDSVLQTRRFELEEQVSVRGVAAQQKGLVANGEHFDTLEMDQYDEFYTATHSFIEAVSDTREASREIIEEVLRLENLFLHQQRLNRALQDMVMSTRTVAISSISPRLQRAVRQAARMTGKDVTLDIRGEQLMVDGDVVAKLVDPLMHLLRNAVDHGVEAPQERTAKGKNAAGLITLEFEQAGNNIVVSCRDDGAGLDYDRILKLAIERGLVRENEILEREAIARLILARGFSTREEATQVSGRGVGMDAVHAAIVELKGTLEIGDNRPGGTTIELRLPVTLLTSHSIVISVGDLQYGIPTDTLMQILSAGMGVVSNIGGELAYTLGRDIYPLRALSSLLGQADNGNGDATHYDGKIILLARTDQGLSAIAVDQVLSSHELVIKNLGKYVGHVRGIAGVSLMGDGRVLPVLNLIELTSYAPSAAVVAKAPSGNESESATQVRQVLVVDDSLSARNTLTELVQDAGFEPVAARDGIEAVKLLQKRVPSLVLTDLEMPRMNGLELTSHIRGTEGIKHLPIIMITSRTLQKHRDQADSAGVTEYVTKPFSEERLMTLVASYMARAR